MFLLLIPTPPFTQRKAASGSESISEGVLMQLKQLTQYTLLKSDKTTICLNELLGFDQHCLVSAKLFKIKDTESYLVLQLTNETLIVSARSSDCGIQSHWRSINPITDIDSYAITEQAFAFIAGGVGYFYSIPSYAAFRKYPLKHLVAVRDGFVGSHSHGLNSFKLSSRSRWP